MARRIAVLSLLVLAGQAGAGAWPRSEGDGFASAALRLGWPQNLLARSRGGEAVSLAPTSRYATLFVEYGLTDMLTVGIDVGHGVSGAAKTIGFLRYPLPIATGTAHRFAAELGLGQIDRSATIRPGLSYGYGFGDDVRSGWFSIDAQAEMHPRRRDADYKLDVTYGLNLASGRRAILQLQSGQQAGDDPFARLAPSYVMPLSDTRQVELGLTVSLTGEADVGVLIGLWQSF